MKHKIFFSLLSASLLLLASGKLSRPSSQEASSFEFVKQILDLAADIDVEGNFAYVASGINGLNIVDVSDPSSASLTSTYTRENCVFRAVDVKETNAYVAQSYFICFEGITRLRNSLHTVDVSNPSSPSESGSEPVNITSPGAGEELTVSGNNVYIANAHGGLIVVDVSNPLAPLQYDPFQPGSADFRDVKVIGNTAYFADLNGKLWIVDVSTPATPSVLASYSFSGNALGVFVEGNLAYIANGSQGLRIVDISDLENIKDAGPPLITPGYARDVEISGGFAFVADTDGVAAIDVSNPAALTQVDHYTTSGFAQRVEIAGQHVYVSDGENGMVILRFTGLPVGKQLNVPLLKQTNPAWGGQEYDHSSLQTLGCGSTVAQCGCVTTSLAMLLNYYGVDRDPQGNPTTPETVNNYFNQDVECGILGCVSKGYKYGSVKWPAIGEYSASSNKNFGTQKIILSGLDDNFSPSIVSQEIESDRPIVLRVPGKQHWVVAKGIDGNSFTINDPGYNRTSLSDPAYGNNALAMRRYEPTASDFSTFEVTALAPAQILVSDSSGKRTGFDPNTSSILEEIPNSVYYFEESYADVTEVNPAPPPEAGIYTVLITTPQQDDFEVQVLAPENELYSFSVHASDQDANTNLGIFEDKVLPGDENIYTFKYDPDPSEESVNFKRIISIDIRPFIGRNFIRRDSRVPVPVSILSTNTFDVPSEVDQSSLTFGRTGNEGSFLRCIRYPFDVNKDGRKDLTCFFESREMGFEKDDTIGILRGQTKDGGNFEGHDSVIIIR